MSSSVFFRFKSSKEPSMVAFDGTGISVFELKREIIAVSKLGDGTDFELVVTSEDGSEKYDDDTAIVQRGTTVIARRLPAVKPGRGGAARYVSGKMPQNAKNTHRSEAIISKPSSTPANLAKMNGAQTEEERVAAVLNFGADQWAQQQQEMANATPVHRAGPNKGKPTNVPNEPPGPGYICNRCGIKGHRIEYCPTNNNPAFDGQRIRRTTGIPRAHLERVEKPAALANDGTLDDTKLEPGIMVNAEGEWVRVKPDTATWDQYQAKAKVSAAAQQAAAQGDKELQDRGLECSIDKRLFLDPTKTPCCEKTFCHDCITNALLDNDLRCPECSTDNIPTEDLKPDEEMAAKIRSYMEEKAAEQHKKESPKSPEKSPIKKESGEGMKSPSPSAVAKTSSPQQNQNKEGVSLKRPADSELVNDRKPPGPNHEAKDQASSNKAGTESSQQKHSAASNMLVNQQPSPLDASFTMPGMNGMTFPMNNYMGMGMSMAPVMGMSTGMPNPMMMPNNFMSTNWNPNMWGAFPQQGMNMNGYQNGMMPNGGYSQQNPMSNGFPNMNGLNGMNGMGMNMNMNMNGMGTGMNRSGIANFANQQRTTFTNHANNDEDSAYFRQPVNPHRHQGRRNAPRPTDYREI